MSRLSSVSVMADPAWASLARERIAESRAVVEALAAGELPEQTAQLAALLVEARRGGGKVILFGNGWSAADASHLVAEVRERTERDSRSSAASRAARDGGLRTAAVTGADGGDLIGAVDLCLRIPSDETPRIQECTMLLGHTVCEPVERALSD